MCMFPSSPENQEISYEERIERIKKACEEYRSTLTIEHMISKAEEMVKKIARETKPPENPYQILPPDTPRQRLNPGIDRQ